MISFSFSGYESGATMAEETKQASISAPKGIVFTCIIAAVIGFIYIVGLLFAMNENIQFVLRNGTNGSAVSNIFYLAFTKTISTPSGITNITNSTGVIMMNLILGLQFSFLVLAI